MACWWCKQACMASLLLEIKLEQCQRSMTQEPKISGTNANNLRIKEPKSQLALPKFSEE